MANSIRDRLATAGVLDHVVLTSETDAMLSALEVTGPVSELGEGITTGAVALIDDLSNSPIPGFDFAFALPQPGITVPFKLKLEPATGPISFKFWLQFGDEEHALAILTFIRGVPGFALTGAARIVDPDGSVHLQALPASDPRSRPCLVSKSIEPGAALGPALLVTGSPASPASIRFTPDTDSTDGVITFGLEPSTVVFGSSNIGFDCPALIIDDSETAAGQGAGAPGLNPPKPSIDADTPSWRGILARELDFYLPADTPLVGGQPIKGYLQLARGQGGAELIVETTLPPLEHPRRPKFTIRIECLDPTANGLSGLVPTLISATMELPLDGATAGFNQDGGTPEEITFAAGKPVQATVTLSRDPANSPGDFKMAVSVAAQGQDGLLAVKADAPGGAKIFNTSAALATALIADKNIARSAQVGDTQGVVLAAVLAAGGALSSLFTDESAFVLHSVEIESSGHGAPVGGPLAFTIDYSVAVIVTGVTIGELSVMMDPNQPMRIRVREARMSIDFTKRGLEMIGLDFDRASLEVENPGAWNVGGLDSLFDVLRSRSGRGSSWIEVDLGFKLNLGPVSVSGATIRATLQPSGQIEATIRGLEAGIEIPGAIKGTGALQLLDHPDGFAADLRAELIPLNVGVDAGVVYAPPLVLLRLDADLPAPIPLASTGFGLLGVGGLLGFSARPDYAADGESDPIAQQLKWTPKGPRSFMAAPGQSSFGLSAAVGTLPDLGFTFSAKAGLLITAPDLAVRGSLNGRVLQPAVKMTDPSWPPTDGVSFVGFLGIDAAALSFGVLGRVALKPLMEVKVPIAGHFPLTGDTSDWYTYLGADGAPVQSRGIGPISATILPDFIGAQADVYLMVRGQGLADWPNGRRLLSIADGFVVAFGFSVQNTFGVKPVVWAELYASLDLLVGSKPPTLAGFGRAGGSLNLGPFSLGVQAQVKFIVAEGVTYFWAEVTGRIELLFFDIEGSVTISFGDHAPALKLPPPDRHPLDRVDNNGVRTGSLGTLTDDRYRITAPLVEDPAQAQTVWPDTIVSLPFAVAPAINQATAGAQFPAVSGPGAPPPPARLGTEMLHYNWRLENVTLRDVTGEADKINGAGTTPPGQLAARWQVPRSGAGGTDVNELLLLSTGPDLWVNRLADGGAGLPGGDPLQQAADICTTNVPDPARGWAVGFLAAPDVPGFRLPPDPVSGNPRVSRVEARMHHNALIHVQDGLPTSANEVLLDNVHALPEPYTIEPASLVAWPRPMTIGRDFEGHIVVPNLRWLADEAAQAVLETGTFLAQEIRLDLAEPVTAGQLILVIAREIGSNPGGDLVTGFHVFDDNRASWTRFRPVSIPTGEVAFIYITPTASPVSRLTVTFPLGVSLGVVGVGGIAVSATDAVQLEGTLLRAEASRRAAAASGPPLLPQSNTPHQRAILDPARLYRIDVDMTWSGQLARQNETGQIEIAGSVDFGDPASHVYGNGQPAKKHLFFATAKKVTTPPPAYGTPPLLSWLLGQQTAFRPEMLQRYLAGYEPGQGEQFRFCDDPLRAHFLQDHVAVLARAYGYEFEVAVRRVDRPGDQYAKPQIFAPAWSYITNPAFLDATDQIRYARALASQCQGPRPGSTATAGSPALERLAWYELYVHARSAEPGFADGMLPSITFQTSRWRDPADMLSGLGFETGPLAPAAIVSGDIAIAHPAVLAPAVVSDDDQAFQNALTALGREGWPPADEPRLSRLWTPDASGVWLFAGLLIESPEPVHRPGRLEVSGLSAQLSGGSPVIFSVSRRDRIGARLLYLTATPAPVSTGPAGVSAMVPAVTLKTASIRDGSVTPLPASLTVPALPSFAGEP